MELEEAKAQRMIGAWNSERKKGSKNIDIHPISSKTKVQVP